jgi:hypothetical protein
VRAAIADVVKQMPEAPRTLILRLARDTALVVSDPVIRQSPILTSDDLLSLLASPPAAATAVSVAHRPDLTEAISDAIAATADSGAIRTLLTNRSAAIREATLDALIAHAPCHTDWHSPLVNRPALPIRAARALSEIVAAELLDTLASRADLEPGLAMDLRQRLAPPREAVSAQAGLTAAQALEETYALRADGRLTEDAISEAVRRCEAVRRGDARRRGRCRAVGGGPGGLAAQRQGIDQPGMGSGLQHAGRRAAAGDADASRAVRHPVARTRRSVPPGNRGDALATGFSQAHGAIEFTQRWPIQARPGGAAQGKASGLALRRFSEAARGAGG